MAEWWRDVRYGAHLLVKAPSFAAVAIVTLALGIGANTAIFSVIQAVLLRPLPYEEADRLVLLTEWSEQVPEMSFSVANFKDVRDQAAVFESVVAYNGANFVLTGAGGEAERLNGRQVTSGLVSTLRTPLLLGRGLTPEDDKPGAPPVALLSEGFWERRFGRDPAVLGRTLTLSGDSFTVVGVLPGDLHGSWKTIEVFTPLLRLEDRIGGDKNRGNHPGIYVIGRLKAGVSVDGARREVVALARRLAQEHPGSNARQSMTLEPLLEAMVGELRPALLLLLGAVALVLLIACANVANLLLARATLRAKEVAVRMALGAGRGRLLRQLLTESVLLALAGGVVGVTLAFGGLRALVASLPATVPRADEIGLDLPVLAATVGLSVLTGLVFGVAPAWRMLSPNLSEPLREGGRGAVGHGHRLRDTLVVGEISLALVLLVGAGLLLRSFLKVMDADPGFRPAGVLTATLPLSAASLADHAQRAAFLERVLEEARAMPGVEAAGATLPLLGGWQSSFNVEGKPEPPPGQRPSADIARVSPDYFRAMGIRVREGRVFDARDRAEAPRVCVVDETFARTHWPGRSPLGKRVKFGRLDDDRNPWLEVVGVVAHVKNYGVDEASRVELYLPYLQDSVSSLTLVVRAAGRPGALSAALRAAVRAADAGVPVFSVRTLEDLLDERTAQRRLAVVLIGVFAGIALLLAAGGIYGVMSYAVAQRTQEIGIRMALGAEGRHVARLVLRHGAVMAAGGIGIGLVVALALARLIRSLLFQTSTADPPTFSLVPLLLLSVALLACYAPARRATRVDPQTALRYE
jgi:putative ABC transport system permease protein